MIDRPIGAWRLNDKKELVPDMEDEAMAARAAAAKAEQSKKKEVKANAGK